MTPISVIAAESIVALRKAASGKYISASYPGTYRFQEIRPSVEKRKFSFE